MDKLILNGTNGFPLHTDTLAEAQRAWNIFNSIAGITGDLAILQGCEQIGTSISDGVVVINGEVLNFKGGAMMPNVIIKSEITQRQFKDNQSRPVFEKRTAQFGVATTSYAWSDFKRVYSTNQIEDLKSDFEKRIKALENKKSAVPIGLVAIWDRPADEIPEGWVEHTELKGKVPAGQDTGIFSSLGSNIGKEEHKLNIANIPQITPKWKSIKGVRTDVFKGRDAMVYTDGGNYKNSQNIDRYPIEKIGSDNPTPISLIQPTRIVKYIRFIGFED